MNTTRLLLILLVAAAVAGCVSMTPEAERVTVVRDPNAVRGCQSLGEIEATSGWGGLFAGSAGLENNKRSLRNQAARRGGDTMLIFQERATFAPHTYAAVYRCSP